MTRTESYIDFSVPGFGTVMTIPASRTALGRVRETADQLKTNLVTSFFPGLAGEPAGRYSVSVIVSLCRRGQRDATWTPQEGWAMLKPLEFWSGNRLPLPN